MSQSSRRWIDLITVVVLLGGAAFVMYLLLPSVTKPGEAVVPPAPAYAPDSLLPFLIVFILMTAIGAPVTGGIVLAVLFYQASKNVPTEPLKAPESSVSKRAKEAPAASTAPQELSPREAMFWKIVATLLVLGVIGVLVWALGPDLVRLFE